MSPVDPAPLHTDPRWRVPAAPATGLAMYPSVGPPPAPAVMNTDCAPPLLPRLPRPPSGAVAGVRAGPFRGLRGVVADLGHPRRVILDTRVLGRAVSIEVDPSLLDIDAPHGTPVHASTPATPAPTAAAATMSPAAAADAAATLASQTRKRASP
jgi:hypothetical protein